MKAQGIGICEWALPTPLRGPLVCRVLKDLGPAAVELKLGTVEKNFPLANRYTLDLYKEEQAKYGTVFTGIAVNLTDFYAMTAPLGSSDCEMVEYALRTAVDAAQYLGAPLIHVPSLHALKSEVRTDEGLKNSAKMQLRQLELVDRENYGIYFDTQSPLYHYTKLVPPLTDEESQSRIAADPTKKHPRDFALWKFTSEEVVAKCGREP